MTGKDALAYMLNDDAIKAIRSPEKDCTVFSDLISTNGISLTAEQLTSDKWQIAYQCTTCEGDGEIEVPCPRCHGVTGPAYFENPCCGGTDTVDCPDCDGGIVWSDDY